MGRETTTAKDLNHYISKYIAAPTSEGTDLKNAYQSLKYNANTRDKQRDYKLKKNQYENPLASVIHSYIGYLASPGPGFYWNREAITITNADVSDHSAISEVARTQLDLVGGLYDAADHVIEQEGRPLDSHDKKHIERCIYQLQSLLELRNVWSVSQKPFTSVDLMVAYGMLVQHDVALGLTGRQIPHEEVAAALTPSVLRVDERATKEVKDIPYRVAMNTLFHVTSKYNFDWVKNSENAIAFALAVLADETDISYKRATEACYIQFLEGKTDFWFYFNFFTHHTSWSWDEKNNCPLLQFVTFADEPDHMLAHGDFMLRNTGKAVQDKTGDMKEYYQKVALELLFQNQKKVSLFKSACAAIFGGKNKRISIDITDIHSESFLKMTL